MDQALIGLAGIVVGALLGATGTYWRLRRDAWSEARANGLILLAAVRAALDDGGATEALLETWDERREVLAKFRRGNYPTGFKAPEWLLLAGCFERLRSLQATDSPSRPRLVRNELRTARRLLRPFKEDPSVLPYVLVSSLKEAWKPLLAVAVVVVGLGVAIALDRL